MPDPSGACASAAVSGCTTYQPRAPLSGGLDWASRIERLGCEPLVKLGAQRIERRLGQRLAGKGKPFGLGALRKSGGE